jgi:SnoaL-like domain
MLLRGIMILLVAALGVSWLNSTLAPAASTDGASSPKADMMDVEAIVSHHSDAFVARDIDAIMSDYTEDSVLITPDGVYTGLESIQSRLQEAMQLGDQSESPFTATNTQIVGPVAYVQWEWPMADGSALYGSDTFIISHGKISNQTVSFYTKPAPEADMMDDPEGMMEDMGTDAADAAAS